MNTQTPQTILDKIKAQNIKPKARWYFVVQHAALWVPAILVTALGTIAFAGELYAVTHSGWEVREFIYPSQIDFLLATMPVLWISSFLLFGTFIVKAFRSIHAGYRFSIKSILIGSVVTSIVLGTAIFYVDKEFQVESIIGYPIHERETALWNSPQQGRLAGTVEEKTEESIVLRDKNNKLWTVDLSEFATTSLPFVAVGKDVRVIGASSEDDGDEFVGCNVLPWEAGSFNRQPSSEDTKPKQKHVRFQNKDSNCAVLLQGIKDHVRGRK
jgi:hypothetical protein